MSRLSTIIIDGRCYRWQDIQRLRREQLAAWEAESKAVQPVLFDNLAEMPRPKCERTTEGRYYADKQASLLPLLKNFTNQRKD